MSPGSWFGWVLIGGGVFVVVFLFVLSMCWAASEGDDVAGEVFARHEGVAAGVPSAPATTPLEPLIDMIGNFPLFHGERGPDMDPVHPEACLCGHDPYYTCPNWSTGGIASMTFGTGEDAAAVRTQLTKDDGDG